MAIERFIVGENTLPLLEMLFALGVDVQSPFYNNLSIHYWDQNDLPLVSPFALLITSLYYTAVGSYQSSRPWLRSAYRKEELKRLLELFFGAGASLSEKVQIFHPWGYEIAHCRLNEIPAIMKKWEVYWNRSEAESIESLIEEAYCSALGPKIEIQIPALPSPLDKVSLPTKATAKELLSQAALSNFEAEQLKKKVQRQCKRLYRVYLEKNRWPHLLLSALCHYFPHLGERFSERVATWNNSEQSIKERTHKALAHFSKKDWDSDCYFTNKLWKKDPVIELFLPIIVLRYLPSIEEAEHLLLLKGVMEWFGCYSEQEIRSAQAIFQIDLHLSHRDRNSLPDAELRSLIHELGEEKKKVIQQFLRRLYNNDLEKFGLPKATAQLARDNLDNFPRSEKQLAKWKELWKLL
jgi:hypothetical protein